MAGALPGPDPGAPGLQGKGGEIPGVDPIPRLIEVIATEYDFNPRELRAEPGEQIIIAIRNHGQVAHSIAFEIDGVRSALDAAVPPGELRRMRLTIPTEPGTHSFYSPLADHRERGMEGSLLVLRPPAVRVEPVATGLVSPIDMVVAPGDPARRRFVIDQVGLVRVLTDRDELLAEPFLDLRERLVELDPEYDERGLLGLAFHPRFAENGRLFVYYSAPLRDGAPEEFDHTSHVSEFTVSPVTAAAARADSERVVLSVDQPQANHNGGTLAFGPDDGLLYVALGDGGGAGDRGVGHDEGTGNAQDTRAWLGSILRVDVDTDGVPFRAPEDDPLARRGGAREVFAYGFRNPYGMSFDPGGTHALFVPDAGEARWEEINRVDEIGGNFGWNVREGTHCFVADEDAGGSDTRVEPSCPDTAAGGEPLLPPIIEFANAAQEGGLGAVVIGGYVYRGSALPELHGRYVFGTFGRSTDDPHALLLAASDPDDGRPDLWPIERIAPEGDGKYYVEHYLKGFGRDELGELYVLVSDEPGPTGESGRVLRLEAPPD